MHVPLSEGQVLKIQGNDYIWDDALRTSKALRRSTRNKFLVASKMINCTLILPMRKYRLQMFRDYHRVHTVLY